MDVTADAICVSPAKNVRSVIVPSRSLAFALSAMSAGDDRIAPLAGAVSSTVGGLLPTVMMNGDDVVVSPALSVARAVTS